MAHDLLPIPAQLSADLAAEIEGARYAGGREGSIKRPMRPTGGGSVTSVRRATSKPCRRIPTSWRCSCTSRRKAGIAPVTTGRRIAAITYHYRDAGLASPRLASPSARDGAGVIAAMLAGVRRKYARKKEQKSPVQAECAAPFFTHVKPLSEQFGFRNWKGQTVRTVFSSAAIGE